jgi:hypothetical protein
MQPRQIKEREIGNDGITLTGWLQGKETYLWVGVDGRVGVIHGYKLYRLAQAVVKAYESE